MTISKQAAKQFTHFPITALWRLLINKNRQASLGPKGFEEEELGYLKSMQAGLNLVLKTIGEPLTAEYVKKLPDIKEDYSY